MMEYQLAKDVAYLLLDMKNMHERIKKLEDEKTKP
tara:strand:- start:338 stop:442 length:105 start_codon:yes stop_codon:yes gene_type:complete